MDHNDAKRYWFIIYGFLCDRPVTDPDRCAKHIIGEGFSSREDAVKNAHERIAAAALEGRISGKVSLRVYDSPEGAAIFEE